MRSNISSIAARNSRFDRRSVEVGPARVGMVRIIAADACQREVGTEKVLCSRSWIVALPPLPAHNQPIGG